jgi:putative heme iron utilization protein
MDASSAEILSALLQQQRVAALGTLRDEIPYVSYVAIVPSPDGSCFYLHASRLAYHTQDFLKDARVSLMIAGTDDGRSDPQTLPRITMQGTVQPIRPSDDGYDSVRTLYLRRFPDAAFNFELGDFSLYAITPQRARYVAGFGKTFNLTAQDLLRLSKS